MLSATVFVFLAEHKAGVLVLISTEYLMTLNTRFRGIISASLDNSDYCILLL